MESSIISSDIYEGEEGQYLALVPYSLNGNQVTPQVLKINVEQKNNHYLISSVDFPLMNWGDILSTNRIRDESWGSLHTKIKK